MYFNVEPLDEGQGSNLEKDRDVRPAEPVYVPSVSRTGFLGIKFLHSTERIILFFSFIAILILILLYFLFGRNTFSGSAVNVHLDGANELRAGDQVEYKLTIENESNIPIENVRIAFYFPEDSVVIREGDVIDNNTLLSVIDRIDGGTEYVMSYKALIVGDSGDIKSARSVVTYRPENINSDFEQSTEWSTSISRLAIPFDLVAPPKALEDQPISYLIDYRNQSDEDLNDLRLIVTFPEGFRPTKFTPGPADVDSLELGINERMWVIPNLKIGDGSRIVIEGMLEGGNGEVRRISATFEREYEFKSGFQYVAFEKKSKETIVTAPLIAVSTLINDSANYVARTDDRLKYNILISNTSELELSGLELSVELGGELYDFTTVRSNGFFDSRSNTIIWDSSTVPELGFLDSFREVEVSFEVRIKKEALPGQNPELTAQIDVSTDNIPANFSAELLSASQTIKTSVSTDIAFIQQLLWNDTEFGTLTPLPPRVDQETVLTVDWTVSNPLNAVANAQIMAVLRPGVLWEGRSISRGGAPLPEYNSSANSVTWRVGSIPEETGSSLPEIKTLFQIAITPSVNQIGKIVPLVHEIYFTGTDTVTGESISIKKSNLSTGTIDDTKLSGIVQP